MEQERKKSVETPMINCPECGGDLIELGVTNEYGFHCDTCSYPYPNEDEGERE